MFMYIEVVENQRGRQWPGRRGSHPADRADRATLVELGVVTLIPFTVHGAIEFVIAIALVAMPWLRGFANQAAARNFYVGSGVVVFIVWLITDYKTAEFARRATAGA